MPRQPCRPELAYLRRPGEEREDLPAWFSVTCIGIFSRFVFSALPHIRVLVTEETPAVQIRKEGKEED